MSAETSLAVALALASTTLTNVAYLREHDAVAALPELSARHPLRSGRHLLTDRSWLRAMRKVGELSNRGADR